MSADAKKEILMRRLSLRFEQVSGLVCRAERVKIECMHSAERPPLTSEMLHNPNLFFSHMLYAILLLDLWAACLLFIH